MRTKSPRKRSLRLKQKKRVRVAAGGGGSPSGSNRRKRRSRSPPRRNEADQQEPTQRKMLVARRTAPQAPAAQHAFPLLPRTPQEAAEHKRRMSSNTLAEEQKLRQIASKSTVNDEALFSYPPDLQQQFLPDASNDNNNPAYQAWYGGGRRRRRSRS